jgi:hypothetical protein
MVYRRALPRSGGAFVLMLSATLEDVDSACSSATAKSAGLRGRTS